MSKEDTSIFKVPSLYEEVEEEEVAASIEPEATPESDDVEKDLITVKGIGAGMAVQLKKAGINSVGELISAQPEELASKVSGASLRKVQEWQGNAKSMIQA